MSNVRHLVIVFQQGRAFDTYFGHYCQALPGSEPSCEDGAACCEGMPTAIPNASQCRRLDPENDTYTPNGSDVCQIAKMNGGAMDRFAGSDLAGCGDPRDFACVDVGDGAGPVGAYHDLAKQGTLADHYFASIADSAVSNLYYYGLTGYLSNISLATTSIGSPTAHAGLPCAPYVAHPPTNSQ